MRWKDQRPVVRLSTSEMECNDQAIAALAASGEFRSRQGHLFWLDPAADRATFVTRELLRELLTRFIRFEEQRPRKREWVPAHPPTWMVSAIIARRMWPGIEPLEIEGHP